MAIILFADITLQWVVLPIAIGMLIFFLLLLSGPQRHKRRAKREYYRSLLALRFDPTNPELRKKTIALGREYLRLGGAWRGARRFDEAALGSDINAACGNVSQPIRRHPHGGIR
jgi:hypothetical protein